MIVMPKALVNLIESLPKKSEYVFCQPNGKPYRQWHVHKAFKKVLKAVGIDSKRYSWKELRHSTASQMHLKGVEVTAIKDQLRHSSSRTTENFYIGSDVSYQRSQIEKLSNERFRGFLTVSKGNSETTVKKEADFETLQEVPPIASA
jgi:site-specific recombinase XerD